MTAIEQEIADTQQFEAEIADRVRQRTLRFVRRAVRYRRLAARAGITRYARALWVARGKAAYFGRLGSPQRLRGRGLLRTLCLYKAYWFL